MKKIFTALFLTLLLHSVQAQQKVIISGVMYDPKGADAYAVGKTTGLSNAEPHLGGFEYIQFLATEDIDFSKTPYAVVTCVNGGDFGGAPEKGWATGADTIKKGTAEEKIINRTYKFNLTSGIAKKGTYFYVGGADKRIAGYWAKTKSSDISEESAFKNDRGNWIAAKAYIRERGDDFGLPTSGLLANGGNPSGIAIFEGTAIDENTIPVDAVLWTTAGTLTKNGLTAILNDSNKGYKLPKNTDIYQSTDNAAYLGLGNNKFVFASQTAPRFNLKVDNSNFLELGGIYDDVNHKWVKTRQDSYSYIKLCADETKASDATALKLKEIEGKTATKLVSTLNNTKGKKK